MPEYPIIEILTNFATQVVNYIPNVVSAIILLIIGLVVGKIAGRVVKEIIVRSKVERYITEGRRLPISLGDILSVITRWWIYLAFITAALSKEVLGIQTLAEWIATINAFIPNVVGAVLIIVVGYAIGEYVRQQIERSGTLHAGIVARIVYFFILYVAVAMALPVLGIPATLVNAILLAIVGSLSLGLAIAIGLGLKDVIAKAAESYLGTSKRRRRR